MLGGGLMRSADPRLLARIEDGLAELSPAATLRRTELPPIVGAALLALDELGAGPAAHSRARVELITAVASREHAAASR